MLALRTAFLSLHIAGGVLGLLFGGLALHPPMIKQFRQLPRRAYAGAVTVLLAFLVGAVVLDWPGLDGTQHIVYAVLVILAAVIVARVFLAFRVARRQPDGWQTQYVNHIYFSYISLWEGLVIVSLVDLGAPAWLVGAVAIGVLILGAILINIYKRRIVPRPESI